MNEHHLSDRNTTAEVAVHCHHTIDPETVIIQWRARSQAKLSHNRNPNHAKRYYPVVNNDNGCEHH